MELTEFLVDQLSEPVEHIKASLFVSQCEREIEPMYGSANDSGNEDVRAYLSLGKKASIDIESLAANDPDMIVVEGQYRGKSGGSGEIKVVMHVAQVKIVVRKHPLTSGQHKRRINFYHNVEVEPGPDGATSNGGKG